MFCFRTQSIANKIFETPCTRLRKRIEWLDFCASSDSLAILKSTILSSQFRISDNIIFYLNLQIPWEVKGKSVNRLAGSQVNKVNPSNNSNNLQGRWDRKKTFVWSVATEPRVTTTTRWLAKAAKAFFGGPSPKTRDMLANILEILVKLTCTWGENAKRAGKVLSTISACVGSVYSYFSWSTQIKPLKIILLFTKDTC